MDEAPKESVDETKPHPLVGGNGHTPPVDSRLVDPFGVLNKPSVFPGHGGVPFRGPVPDLKSNDPEHKQPQISVQAHVEILSMEVEKDLLRYQEIMQIIGNGFGQLGAEERQYDKETKNWRIFVRWWELFSYVPNVRTENG
jgi:hypothetical protein